MMETLNLVFSWLLRASWQASVLSVLVLAVQWAFRNKLSPGWRCALWLLVLARLIMPVSPQSPLSIFNLTNGASAVASNPYGNFSDAQIAAPALAPSSGSDADPRTSTARTSVVPNATVKTGPGNMPRPTRAQPFTLPTLRQTLALLWLAGACLLGLRMIWQNLRFARRVLKRRQVTESTALEVLEDCKQWMSLRTPLTVIETEEVKCPALYGFVRPRLVLPQGTLASFTPHELRYIFLHELAHVKRCDMVVNWIVSILHVLHWFNPVLWFAFARLAADREIAADALALSRAPEADEQSYGQTIIKLLESFTRPAPVPGLVGILEDKQQMRRRIAMIAQFNNKPRWPVLPTVVAAVITLVGLTDAQTVQTPETGKAASREKAAAVTLRRLPDFKARLRDISRDGHYGLGNVTLSDSGPVTVPFVVDLVSGAERRFETTYEKPGWPVALRFSADGKQILCARLWEKGSNYMKELLLLDMESGKLRRIYRNEEIDTIWVQDWSADGKTILATFEKEDQTGINWRKIALISIEDGTARTITTGDPNRLPGHCAFSPDLRLIAYDAWPESGSGDIRVVGVDGTGDTLVVDHPAKDRLLGWAASSDQIVFQTDRRGVDDAYTLKIANGRPAGDPVLLRELGRGVGALRLTLSGDFFFSKTTRDVDVYFANIDPASGRLQGKPIKAHRVEGRSQWPAWSSDGRFLAYIITDSQDGIIGIRDVESGAIRELNSVTPRVSFPHWSNDGKSIFALSYSSGQRIAYRISVETSEAAVVIKEAPYWINIWPLWSWAPDGKSFYYYANRKNAFSRVDVETGKRKDFEIAGSGESYFSLFSPDSKHVVRSITKKDPPGARALTRTISVVPFAGGEPRELVQLVGPEADASEGTGDRSDQGLCWSPDGRYVLFVKANPTDRKMRSLWRVPFAGGEPEDLGLEMERLRHPTISLDGRRIAFTAGGSRNELWVMENFLPKDNVAAK